MGTNETREDIYLTITGALPPEYIDSEEPQTSEHEDLRAAFDGFVEDGGTLNEFLVALSEVCSDMSYPQTVLGFLTDVIKEEDERMAVAFEARGKAKELTKKFLADLGQIREEYSLLVEQGVIADSSLLFYIAEGVQEFLPVDNKELGLQIGEVTDESFQNTDKSSNS